MLSGLLGIGGGFISTPLLILIGVPPSVAVATSAHQIVGTSFSGILPRIKPKKVDFKLGFFLAIFGIFGTLIGTFIFSFFEKSGNIDGTISIFYLIIMSIISFLSFKTYFAKSKPREAKTKINFLPIYFKTSNVECSILIPFALGTFTGILSVMMGVGGGFILVPAMVYFMGVKNDIAIGTSLLQILVITIGIVLFHIFKTGLLDVLLGTLLILGSAIGSQISSAISLKIGRGKIIHLLLGILTLLVGSTFGAKLFFSSQEDILIQEYNE